MKPYFILSTSDDTIATLESIGMKGSYWQILLGTPGTVAVITSVIGGAFIGLLLDDLFKLPLSICAGSGGIFFLASVIFALWVSLAAHVSRHPAATHALSR